MNRTEAMLLLNLTGKPGPDAVREAFRRRAQALILPDKDAVIEPFYSIEELRAAREVLINSDSAKVYACKVCRGSGKTQVGMLPQTCMACGGTGEKR